MTENKLLLYDTGIGKMRKIRLNENSKRKKIDLKVNIIISVKALTC